MKELAKDSNVDIDVDTDNSNVTMEGLRVDVETVQETLMSALLRCKQKANRNDLH